MRDDKSLLIDLLCGQRTEEVNMKLSIIEKLNHVLNINGDVMTSTGKAYITEAINQIEILQDTEAKIRLELKASNALNRKLREGIDYNAETGMQDDELKET